MKKEKVIGYPTLTRHTANPSASFIDHALCVLPFMQHMARPGTDQHTTKASPRAAFPRSMQKITPIKLALSYINIRRHYTTPHGLIDV